MADNKLEKKRGRPANHPSEVVLSRIWYQLVARAAGVDTPDQLSLLLEGRKDTSHIWRRYESGLRIPGKYGQMKQFLAAEARWPGIGGILKSPVRDVLAGKGVAAKDAVSAIADLGPPWNAIVLSDGYLSHNDSVPRNIDHVFSELELFPSLKTLEAIILMLGWADDLQNIDFWNNICGFYRHMIPFFIERGEIPLFEDLFDAVDKISYLRIFSSLNKIDHNYESWKSQLPRYEKMIADQELIILDYFEKISGRYGG